MGIDPNAHALAPGRDGGALAGIWGWLLLPAIGLLVSPFVHLFEVLVGFGWLANRSGGSIQTFATIHTVVKMTLVIYTSLTAWDFFRRRRCAPRQITHLLLIRCAASLVLFILGLVILPPETKAHRMLLVSAVRENNLLAQVVAATIWIPYFRVSRRVAATFVR